MIASIESFSDKLNPESSPTCHIRHWSGMRDSFDLFTHREREGEGGRDWNPVLSNPITMFQRTNTQGFQQKFSHVGNLLHC